ncbi:uncharacterized protein K02A2.6-like [Uranotaenia lowii]|uniref:uncharacterized protein K02A2.6-like n=1 Tax=Uranotaenia lowii TaxID=190385 RepID=UPI00247A7D5F|nr:uncharacterized protein K02A2.6-like [Uranotaenia lowii]
MKRSLQFGAVGTMMDAGKFINLEPFDDTVDASNLRLEWEEWHRSCELVMQLMHFDSQNEKLLFMLARGGRGLQRIYCHLAPVSGEFYPPPAKVPFAPVELPEYDNAIKRLNSFFVGKRNERVELEVFRSLRQSSGESFNRYLLRLRTQAARCDFRDRTEKELLHQITIGSLDEKIRDKGMEDVMTLDELINYAMNREVLIKQKEKFLPFKSEPGFVSSVNRNYRNYQTTNNQQIRRPFKRRYQSGECDGCGSWRHHVGDQRCSARDASCNRCGRKGHFLRKCPKFQGTSQPGRYTWKKSEVTNALHGGPEADFNQNGTCQTDSLPVVKENASSSGIITCFIDQLPVTFLIDSGAAINTVTEEIWKQLVDSNAKLFKKRHQCDRVFTAYASQKPLQINNIFEAWISINESKPRNYAEFFVIQGAHKCLLSKRTAEDLKVLKVGLDVQHVGLKQNAFPKFPNVQIKLSIDRSVVPRKITYLRIPVAMEEKVDKKIQQMLDTDVIEPVHGPAEWISPMVVVPKGTDDVRLCINMRYPNQAIKREHYPLPLIDTLLNKFKGSKIFSKLDITSAYHHVELHPESRDITTFMTSRGLMRFKRLNFGINCAPEMFQRIMSEMLIGIEGVVVYIDDIVVSGKTREEHDRRLNQVLHVLKENNATLNHSKCSFGVEELEILGFKINTSGISPAEDKIKAIKNFRAPETKEEARSFLGLINFVGQFIPHLSTRTEPIRKFIRGDVPLFGQEQIDAFVDLRDELTNTVHRLGYFDPNDTTELYVDASPVGLGAVLVQKNEQKEPRIISYASKGLTKAERVYPQTQREALSVVWAVEKFYAYLFGMHFTIFTDHKTLEYIYGGKHHEGKRACSRAEAWALRLQPYDFSVKYIPGTENISDCFSRLCPQSDNPFDESSEHYVCELGEGPTAITLEDIKKETQLDKIIQAVMKAVESGSWPSELYQYEAFSKELGIANGILIRENRIVLPMSLRQKALNIAHRGHPGSVTMKRNLRENVWWPCMDKDVANRIQECAGCAAVSSQHPPEPMTRKEMPDRAWQELAIDFFSAKECATFLVVIDYYSRFLTAIEMKSTDSAHTVEALENMFKIHTYPETIRADNGPPFASEDFKEYCVSKNIRLIRTIPYWPQMNGLVERQNQGILRALRIAKVMKQDWRKAVQEYVYAYNTRPHSVTGKTPMELLTGRPVKDLLPSLRTEPYWSRDDEVRDNDAIRKMQGKIYADNRRHAKKSNIKVGDTVMIRNYDLRKLCPGFQPVKYTVIRRSGVDVHVASEDGVVYRRPVSHLKLWPIPHKVDTSETEQDFEKPSSNPNDSEQLESKLVPKVTKTTKDVPKAATTERPKRNSKKPARFVE